MNMENKKISFGFSKIVKKTSIKPQKAEKAELIECLEGSEIKVKNPVVKVEKKPLVIAIKGNPNNLLGRIQTEALKHKNKKNDEEEDTRPDSELTIEELAARQLIREAKEKLAQKKETAKVHTLPLVEEAETSADAQESTMDDYENIPINDYGMAMLRGMGWQEGMCIGKNQSNFVKPPDPELRPKGLGLGAQKMIQAEPEDVFDKNGKQLILTKGAFAKITAGPHKGTFCEVQGLDDEAGRIIVKMNKTNDILTLNELFVKPVTKEEYALGSKVINNAKYEEYKEKEIKGKKDRNYNSEDERYGGKAKHRDGKHGYSKREESEDSMDYKRKNRNSRRDESEDSSDYRRNRNSRRDQSEDSSDEYRRNRNSRREVKEESDDSTDEYKRNKSKEKYKNDSRSRKQSKSRYRSKDKYKSERRRDSSSESSSEEHSSRKKSSRRRNSEDSNNKHRSKSSNKSKSHKHKKHSKSRNDSSDD